MTFAAAIILIAAGAIVRFAGLILAFVQELIWSDRAKSRGNDPPYPPR